jgi:predicted transcriptional regulator
MATSPKPTDAELQILRVLWKLGSGTVRDVYNELNQQRETGYTTVLKLMQIMTEKGLVIRDESERTHVYRAKVSADLTQKRLVKDLLDRVFEGSATQLVMQALSAKRVSAEELAEIKRLLAEHSDEVSGSK